MTHRIVVVVLMLLFTFLVTSCDKSTDPAGGLPAALVGTWVFQSITINSQSVPLAVALEWVQGTVSAAAIVDAAGNYTYNEYDGTNATGTVLYYSTGTATVNGQTLTLTTNNDNGTPVTPDVIPFTYALSGATLTLSVTDPTATPPETIVAVLQKK